MSELGKRLQRKGVEITNTPWGQLFSPQEPQLCNKKKKDNENMDE